MGKEKDISESLERLKEMPYGIPEGYFSGLGEKVLARIAEERHRRRKRAAYLSAAAVSAAIIAGGGLYMLSEKADGMDDIRAEYLFYQDTDIIPVTAPETLYLSSSDESSDALTAEDIIDYLVYSGIEPEEIFY